MPSRPPAPAYACALIANRGFRGQFCCHSNAYGAMNLGYFSALPACRRQVLKLVDPSQSQVLIFNIQCLSLCQRGVLACASRLFGDHPTGVFQALPLAYVYAEPTPRPTPQPTSEQLHFSRALNPTFGSANFLVGTPQKASELFDLNHFQKRYLLPTQVLNHTPAHSAEPFKLKINEL